MGVMFGASDISNYDVNNFDNICDTLPYLAITAGIQGIVSESVY